MLEPGRVHDAIKVQAARQEQFQAKVATAANKLGQSLRPSDEDELGKIRLKLLNRGLSRRARGRRLLWAQADRILLGLGDCVPAARHQIWDDAK